MPRRKQAKKIKQRPEYNFNKGLRDKQLDHTQKGGIYIHTPFHPVVSSNGDYMILKVGYTEDTLYSRMSQCFYTDYPYGLYEIAYFQFDSLLKKEWMIANKTNISQQGGRTTSKYFVEYYVEQQIHSKLRKEEYHLNDHVGVKQSEWYQVKLSELDEFINHVYITIATCFSRVFTHHLFNSFIVPHILKSQKLPIMKSKNNGFRKYIAHLLCQLDDKVEYDDVHSKSMTDLIKMIGDTANNIGMSLKDEWFRKMSTWYDPETHAIAMTGMIMKAYWMDDTENISAIMIRGSEHCLFRTVKLVYPKNATHKTRSRTTRLLLPDRKDVNQMIHKSMKEFGKREYSPVFCMIKYNIYNALLAAYPGKYKTLDDINWNSLRGLYALSNVFPLQSGKKHQKTPPKQIQSNPALQTPKRKSTNRFNDSSDNENNSSSQSDSWIYMAKIGYAYGFSNDDSIVDNEKEMEAALNQIDVARKEQEELAKKGMRTRQAGKQAADILKQHEKIYNKHYQKHRQLIHAQPHHQGGFLARFDNCYRGDYVFGWMPLYFLVIDTSIPSVRKIVNRAYLKTLEAQVHEALRYALAYSITRRTGEWFAATSQEVKRAFSVAQTFLNSQDIPCTIVDMFSYSVPSHTYDCSTTYLPAELLSANMRTFERRYASFDKPPISVDELPGMNESFLRPSNEIMNLIKEANKDPLYKNKHDSKLIEQQDIHDMANVKLNKIVPQELQKIEAYQERLITFLSKYSDMFASFHSMYPAIRVELNQNRELLQNHYNTIQNHLLQLDNALIKKGDKKHMYSNDGRQHSRLSLAYGRIQQSIYDFVKKHPPTGATYKKMPIMSIPFIGEWIQQMIRDDLFEILDPTPANKTDIFIHDLLSHMSKFQSSKSKRNRLKKFLQRITKNRNPNKEINSRYTTHETNFGALLAICFLCIMISKHEQIAPEYASIKNIIPHIQGILLELLGFNINESSMTQLTTKKQMKQMKKSTVHVSASMKDMAEPEASLQTQFDKFGILYDSEDDDSMKDTDDIDKIEVIPVTERKRKPKGCSKYKVHTLRWQSNSCYIDSVIMYFSFLFHGSNKKSKHPFIQRMKSPLQQLITLIQTKKSLKHIIDSTWFLDHLSKDKTHIGEIARNGSYGYANDILLFVLQYYMKSSIIPSYSTVIRLEESVQRDQSYDTIQSFKNTNIFNTLLSSDKRRIRKSGPTHVIYLDSNSSSIVQKASTLSEPAVLPCITIKPYLHQYTKHDKYDQNITPHKRNGKKYVISMKHTDTKNPSIALYEFTPRGEAIRFKPVFEHFKDDIIDPNDAWVKQIIKTYCSELTIHHVPSSNTQMILCDILIGEMDTMMKGSTQTLIAMSLCSKETNITFDIKGILYKTGGHTTLYITNQSFWYYYDDMSVIPDSIECVGTYREWFPYAMKRWAKDKHRKKHQMTLIYERRVE